MIKSEIQLLPPSPQCWSLVHSYLVSSFAVRRGQCIGDSIAEMNWRELLSKHSTVKFFPQLCHLLNHVTAQNIL